MPIVRLPSLLCRSTARSPNEGGRGEEVGKEMSSVDRRTRGGRATPKGTAYRPGLPGSSHYEEAYGTGWQSLIAKVTHH